MTVIVQRMLDLIKYCYNCFLLSLIQKHVNELQFFISNREKFSKLIKLILHNLTYLSLLYSFLFSSTFSIFLKTVFFLHPAVSHIFQGPALSGSWFFRVQFFQVPGFSGFRFVRVQVFQGLGQGYGSRFQKQIDARTQMTSVNVNEPTCAQRSLNKPKA